MDDDAESSEAGVFAQTGFEYQTMITTWISLMMYTSSDGYGKINEIYTELSDDILLVDNDQKSIVVQVTYNNFNNPLKLNDVKVIKSLEKFVKLKIKYNNSIESFKIISNTGFKNVQYSTRLDKYYLENIRDVSDFKNRYRTIIDSVSLEKGIERASFMETLEGKLYNFFGSNTSKIIKELLVFSSDRSTLGEYYKDQLFKLEKPHRTLKSKYKRIDRTIIDDIIQGISQKDLHRTESANLIQQRVSFVETSPLIQNDELDKILMEMTRPVRRELLFKSMINKFEKYSRDHRMTDSQKTWEIIHKLLECNQYEDNLIALLAIRNFINLDSHGPNVIRKNLEQEFIRLDYLETLNIGNRIKDDVFFIFTNLLNKDEMNEYCKKRIIFAISEIEEDYLYSTYYPKFLQFFIENKNYVTGILSELERLMLVNNKGRKRAHDLYDILS